MTTKSKKQFILEAAIDLFSEKGFTIITINDIAKQVGIQGPSIYSHFKSKDEIISSIMELHLEKTMKRLTRPNDFSILEIIKDKSFDEAMEYIFAPFEPEEAELIRKMNRILMIEQFIHPKAMEYWQEIFIKQTCKCWQMILTQMMNDKKIPSINVLLAAEMLTRIPLTYIIQFAHFQAGERTDTSLSMAEMNAYIFDRIRNGEI